MSFYSRDENTTPTKKTMSMNFYDVHALGAWHCIFTAYYLVKHMLYHGHAQVRGAYST